MKKMGLMLGACALLALCAHADADDVVSTGQAKQEAIDNKNHAISLKKRVEDICYSGNDYSLDVIEKSILDRLDQQPTNNQRFEARRPYGYCQSLLYDVKSEIVLCSSKVPGNKQRSWDRRRAQWDRHMRQCDARLNNPEQNVLNIK